MESADRARAILREHHDMLDKLAEALLERETMSAAEIRELLGLPADDSASAESSAVPAPAAEPAPSAPASES